MSIYPGHIVERVTVTEDHVKLVNNLKFDINATEFGAPTVDPKRPFGNSDVYADMERILKGRKVSSDFDVGERRKRQLDKLYVQLKDCLQILCDTLSLKPVTYERRLYEKWHEVKNG